MRNLLLAISILASILGHAQTRDSFERGQYDVAFNFFDFLGYNANIQGTYFFTDRWGAVIYGAHGLRSTGEDNFPPHENYRLEFGGRYLVDPVQSLFVHFTYQHVFTTAWYSGDEWVEVFRDGLYYYELQRTRQSESYSQSGVTLYMGKRWSRGPLFVEFLMGIGYRQSTMSDREEIFALDDIVHSGYSGVLARMQFLLGVKLN